MDLNGLWMTLPECSHRTTTGRRPSTGKYQTRPRIRYGWRNHLPPGDLTADGVDIQLHRVARMNAAEAYSTESEHAPTHGKLHSAIPGNAFTSFKVMYAVCSSGEFKERRNLSSWTKGTQFYSDIASTGEVVNILPKSGNLEPLNIHTYPNPSPMHAPPPPPTHKHTQLYKYRLLLSSS